MVNRVLAGKKGKEDGDRFEKKYRAKYLVDKPENQHDIWGQRITISKSDTTNNKSIKNPSKYNTSIQVQVCSVERFSKLLKPPQEVYSQLSQFVGNQPSLHHRNGFKNNPAVFKDVCRDWGVNTTSLSLKKELMRSRLLCSSITNFSEVTDWFQDNLENIYKFVLSTGFNNPDNTETIAKQMVWAREKNNIDSIVEYDIESIIKNIYKIKVKVRPSNSVIEFGPMTLQMKGSGKCAAYHNMQFNMSLKDLETFLGVRK